MKYGTSFNHLSMNVGGLNNPIKRRRLRKLCSMEKNCVVCLQETHLQDQDIGYLGEVFHGKIWHSGFSARSRGVMIGVSNRLPWVSHRVVIDPYGLYVILHSLLGQVKVSLVGLYAPNTQQIVIWREVLTLLESIQGSSLIIFFG